MSQSFIFALIANGEEIFETVNFELNYFEIKFLNREISI